MPEQPAAGVSRRLLYRMAADVLNGCALRLRTTTQSPRTFARPFTDAGRHNLANVLAGHAITFRDWATEHASPDPDVDAAVAGLCLAWLAEAGGGGNAWRGLDALLARLCGSSPLDGIDKHDLAGVVKAAADAAAAQGGG